MRSPAAWASAAVFVHVALVPSLAAAAPQEDLVRRWLDVMSYGLPVQIGASSFDPARQAVQLENVVFGGPESLVTITYPSLTIEDPRLTGDGHFAAHSVRASGVTGTLKVDLARWFPEIAESFARLEDGGSGDEGPVGDDDAADGSQTPPDGGAPSPGTEPPSGGDDGPDGMAEDGTAGDDAAGSDTAEGEPFPAYDTTFAAETMLYERLVTPMTGPAIGPDADLAERLIAYARWSLAIRADWIEVDNVRYATEGFPDGDTETTYTLQYVSGMHDGRIERLGFNDMRQTGTSGGARQTATIGGSYAVGIDIGAALDVLDPAAFRGGVGDGRWRTVALQQGYNDLAFEFEGGRLALGNVEANGVRVRQTGKPILPTIMGYLADPARVEADPGTFLEDIIPGAVGFYGVDFVQMSDLSATATDGGSFEIGQIDLNEMDSDGIGAMTFRSISANAGEAGSGTLGMVTLNDLRFGDLMAWINLGMASETGEPPPEAIREAILDGSPTLSFFEMTELAVETPGGSVALDALAITEGDFLRALPRRYDLTFTNLSLPAALAGDPSVVDQLARMGYEQLVISGAGSFAWNTERGDVRIEDVTLHVDDMGRLSASLHLGNLPLSILDDADRIEQRMAEGTLVSGSLVFGNQSIVERTFQMKAEELNQPAETFRKNFAAALPLMLGFLEEPQIQKTFQGALRTFFEDPQSLVVTVKPAAPLPFSVLETISTEAPGEVMKLLNFEIRANQ